MASLSSQNLFSSLLEPTPTAIILTILIVLTIPLFLHLLIFRSPSSTNLPTILLLGPSNSGKTSLLTLFEHGQPTETRTSQTPLTVEISLPISSTKTLSTTKYRSAHDPTLQIHKRFFLADTPGHGKLRHYAFDSITKPKNLKGIIFMVDAADLSPSSSTSASSGGSNDDNGLRQAAEYLHSILLLLQKQPPTKTPAAPFPILIAANKLDLFTALPASLVRSTLEKEISLVRQSHQKGLLDSGVGGEEEEERDWLGDLEGEGGEGGFSFGQMEGVGVEVVVVGGNVVGADGGEVDVGGWWEWIGERV